MLKGHVFPASDWAMAPSSQINVSEQSKIACFIGTSFFNVSPVLRQRLYIAGTSRLARGAIR
jgi:hypothetical protein